MKNGKSIISKAQLWKIIKDANWSKDHDYKRIAKEFQALPHDIRAELKSFIQLRYNELYDRFKKDWLANPGIRASDDGWSDILAEVIGRGKPFYDNITVKELKRMANELDYTESFLYTIHGIKV